MSTDRATGIESTGPTDDESPDQLTQLQRRLDALEAENKRVVNELRAELQEAHSQIEHLQSELEDRDEQRREDRHALARESHQLRASNQQLQERADQAEAERDELRERVDRADASRGHIIEDIVDVEEQLADVEAGSAGSRGGSDAAETTMQRPNMTPIERLSTMDAEDTAIDMTPSIERAVSIFDHWKEWSDKTPKGRVLKSGLKTLLRTATGETLAWRQVYRAAEALEELSKGRIEFIDHNRHGKMLVETQPARSESGHCHSSSAATT